MGKHTIILHHYGSNILFLLHLNRLFQVCCILWQLHCIRIHTLCHQAVQFATSRQAVMLFGWEGNHGPSGK